MKRQIRQPPVPINRVTLVSIEEVKELQTSEISTTNIGHKAWGLSTLPKYWRPDFFVIDDNCFDGKNAASIQERLREQINEAIKGIGLSTDSPIMLRSSGAAETIDIRGQFDSLECKASEVWQRATALHALQKTRSGKIGLACNVPVHIIVQQCVWVACKGHLSNERRLSHEHRDFVAEFEPINGRVGHAESVAIRKWRTGHIVDESPLDCASRTAIGLVLQRVGTWAMSFDLRVHFEWVWSGSRLFIVQADFDDHIDGIDPHTLLPKSIPSFNPQDLGVFRLASDKDFSNHKKLANAKLYSTLGYRMPPFYILNDEKTITEIMNGRLSPKLLEDLSILTSRPLIIRTDLSANPKKNQFMLPRSDELRALTDASDWMLSTFRLKVKELGLEASQICLIAHHFIPSVSSAWARAEPNNPLVRIEALWGIPEGLYWHSHDTFEVDTGSSEITPGLLPATNSYKLRERCRYKGTFVGADEAGRWVPQKTDSAHDWARSVKQKSWIFEIATTTRKIAEESKMAVSVMWFIDNHEDATKHRVLPWFHSPSPLEINLKAAPRHKRISARDWTIKTQTDWQSLKQYLQTNADVERVVMAPEDTDLIRNPSFAEELANTAKEHDFVIELSGGLLSHAYYLLNKAGCQVECVDLFGVGEEIIEFNKLVRDKIPEIITARGERTEKISLAGDALIHALRKKLVEESFELLDALSADELLSELADVQEVIYALTNALGLSLDSLEKERKSKSQRRGGFTSGTMLLKTVTPQSIGSLVSSELNEDLLADGDMQEQTSITVSNPVELPRSQPYRRPDLRSLAGTTEKVFSFKTDVESIESFREQLAFTLPLVQQGTTNFLLSLELTRHKSKLNGKVRLSVSPVQLTLPI